jgi:homoserine kinase type II
MQSYDYRNILKTWDIKFNTTRIDKKISGSSERTDFRVVIEDEKNKLYVIEKINRNQYKNKLMINKTLQYLFDKGLKKIQPYIKNKNFDYISEIDDCLWQLHPYISNIELNKPKYVFDGWRGEILAEFLIDLWDKSKNLSYFDKNNPFDLRDYFLDMKQKMKIYNISEYNRIKNQIKYIEKNFLNIYYDIPILFCHGDYHPLNIIWTKNDIKSVIDWEFTGYKSEIYDISNLLGCIGI